MPKNKSKEKPKRPRGRPRKNKKLEENIHKKLNQKYNVKVDKIDEESDPESEIDNTGEVIIVNGKRVLVDIEKFLWNFDGARVGFHDFKKSRYLFYNDEYPIEKRKFKFGKKIK
jgi:hypothetical protein